MSSRHRSDPAGRGHWALIGAMVATVVALAVIGVYALFFALNAAAPGPGTVAPSTDAQARSSATPSSRPPALSIKITGEYCDVFVGVPQGSVLVRKRMNRGDEITLDEPLLAAVVSDAQAAEVTINGELQPPGGPGERRSFTIKRPDAEPAETLDPATP